MGLLVDSGNNWAQAPDDGVSARTNNMTVDSSDRGRVLIGYDDIGYQEIAFSTDIQLADDSGPLAGATGEALSVAMTVTANGPITANAAQVEIAIPSEVTIDTAVANTGACAIDGQDISCTLGTLAVAGSSTVSLSLTALVDGEYTVVANATSLELILTKPTTI